MWKSLCLQNAIIYDGSGKPPQKGNLVISDETIKAVGAVDSQSIPAGAKKADLGGLAIAPGFINIHSHSDTGVLLYPQAKALIMQGITTEIIGNCGGSAVDISEDGRGRGELEKAGVTELWNGVKGYLDTVNKIGPAVNVGALFGHGDIRKLIVGNDGRPLTPDELDRMESMAEERMAQGALGVSSGLEYVPGRCANVEELSAISKGVAKYNGIHASHIRNEGPQLIGSVQEVVEVAKSSGVRMEVSHLKACGPTNWGKVKTALEIMDNNGVTADFYPYLASSTELAIVLPDWVVADGKEAGVSLLQNQGAYEKAVHESHQRTEIQGGWDKVVVTRVTKPENKWMEGIDMASIARRLGKEAAKAAVDLLIEERMRVGIVRFAMSEEDMITAMKHPQTCVVTDGRNQVPTGGKIHPRSMGTFPRVLGRYVREKQVIPMEEAIRKMTSLPAKRLNLKDRGLLAPGLAADLVIFDPETIIDHATYEDPWQYPTGIFGVIVNGVVTIWEGNITEKRGGKAISRQ